MGVARDLLLNLFLLIDGLHTLLTSPLFNFAFQGRIIMVLDVVVRTAGQVLGNLRPAVAVDLMELKDTLILLEGPLDLFNVWIEMIVPSDTSKKSRELGSNELFWGGQPIYQEKKR